AMAFADDLAIVSGSWEGMRANLDILVDFCELTGMRTQPSKCHGFLIEKSGSRSYKVNRCESWLLNGIALHMIGLEESVRYLGVQVNPWTGIFTEDMVAKLRQWVAAISKTPLDPLDKLSLLCRYAVQSVIFVADHCMLSAKARTEMDLNIRRAVKRWLHLARCTTNGLLYSRTSSGGLGIPKMSMIVPAIQARRLLGLSRSKDEMVRWMSQITTDTKVFERAWLSAGGSPDEVPEIGPVLVEGSSSIDWRQLIQGKGIRMFEADEVSNCWLTNYPPNKLKSGDFTAAVQLRANLYPTRELVGRGRTDTVDHIIALCPKVKLCRIQRHHRVCQVLVAQTERHGWEVEREKRWTLPSGKVMAPDMICWLYELAIIIDVTVRYKFDESLERAQIEKETKYRPLLPVLRASRARTRKVTVHGFTLGARGKWPTKNELLFADLGLSKAQTRSFAELLSRRVLLYSLDIMRTLPYHAPGLGKPKPAMPATGVAH
uniref:Reverse transcriptase domain-containing protein n=1 Tax=Gasterosteus aculeatus TaxID=69293 RepID=G3N5H5_GASAC